MLNALVRDGIELGNRNSLAVKRRRKRKTTSEYAALTLDDCYTQRAYMSAYKYNYIKVLTKGCQQSLDFFKMFCMSVNVVNKDWQSASGASK